eukprot:CAMPEP_0197516592 /NCGR_PEP_ID=MMETSP1318-20131121/1498_1 /TAXON_ID=552666 /ORGANISM="Partenskyella glossopodia, Strain RCC365" /LENGTH=94 /DNA_ID=CAMNT_0043065461 /DNA_START=476 /DNA_END=760 /DNA_ORIENTATION=+
MTRVVASASTPISATSGSNSTPPAAKTTEVNPPPPSPDSKSSESSATDANVKLEDIQTIAATPNRASSSPGGSEADAVDGTDTTTKNGQSSTAR